MRAVRPLMRQITDATDPAYLPGASRRSSAARPRVLPSGSGARFEASCTGIPAPPALWSEDWPLLVPVVAIPVMGLDTEYNAVHARLQRAKVSPVLHDAKRLHAAAPPCWSSSHATRSGPPTERGPVARHQARPVDERDGIVKPHGVVVEPHLRPRADPRKTRFGAARHAAPSQKTAHDSVTHSLALGITLLASDIDQWEPLCGRR